MLERKLAGINLRKWSKGEWIFSGFLLCFFALFVFVEWKNGKLWTNDFRVYYDATRDFLAGNDPYVHAYGLSTGFFKYPPFTLYLFAPVAVMPYEVAQFIHLLVLTGSMIVSMHVIRYLARVTAGHFGKTLPIGFLYLGFVSVAIHLTRELHMGNINLILLALFCVGLKGIVDGRSWQTIVCWSLMLILKPIMILIVLPLVVYKGWNLLVRMGVMGVFFLLFPMLFVGWNGNVGLWKGWFKAISAHGDYLTSFNSIGSLVKMITGFQAGWIVALAMLCVLLGLMVKDRLRNGVSTSSLSEWAVLLSAFVPNFFLTDTEHFLLSLPLILFQIQRMRAGGKWYHVVLFTAGMLCFSFNSSDLLGSTLSDFIYDHGFLGIGNLLFLFNFLMLKTTNHSLKLQGAGK